MVKNYNFIYSTSNEYAPYCATSINSLLINNSDMISEGEVAVYILSHDLDERNKKVLSSVCVNYNAKIKIVNCKDKVLELLSCGAKLNFNPSSFIRIFIPQLFQDVDKALFVDSDTYINGSLKEMYDIDLTDSPCAMCCNSPVYREMQEEANIDIAEPYYNAGIMLMNLKYWREHNLVDRMLQFYFSKKEGFPTDDQSVINAFVASNAVRLPYKYNMMIVIAYSSYKKFCSINLPVGCCAKKEYVEAQESPAIIHFNGPGVRPWEMLCAHPYTKMYRKMLFSLYPDIKLTSHRGKVYLLAQYFKHKIVDNIEKIINK